MTKYLFRSLLAAAAGLCIQILNYHYLTSPFSPDIIAICLLGISIIYAVISIGYFIKDAYNKIKTFFKKIKKIENHQ